MGHLFSLDGVARVVSRRVEATGPWLVDLKARLRLTGFVLGCVLRRFFMPCAPRVPATEAVPASRVRERLSSPEQVRFIEGPACQRRHFRDPREKVASPLSVFERLRSRPKARSGSRRQPVARSRRRPAIERPIAPVRRHAGVVNLMPPGAGSRRHCASRSDRNRVVCVHDFRSNS